MRNQYSVMPFCGDNYQKNSSNLKADQYGCAICGKPLKLPVKHEATVVGGGDWAQTEAEEKDTSDPGYMGVWGIGPDCHKKYLIKNN